MRSYHIGLLYTLQDLHVHVEQRGVLHESSVSDCFLLFSRIADEFLLIGPRP